MVGAVVLSMVTSPRVRDVAGFPGVAFSGRSSPSPKNPKNTKQATAYNRVFCGWVDLSRAPFILLSTLAVIGRRIRAARSLVPLSSGDTRLDPFEDWER